MTRWTNAIAAVAAACVLAACAAPKPDMKSALATVQTIVIVRPPPLDTYTVDYHGRRVGIVLDFIVDQVTAGDVRDKQARLTAALNQQIVPVTDYLVGKVAEKLSRQGFQVTVEDGPWEVKDGKPFLAYENLQTNADAVLVIAPGIFGFVARCAVCDYVPTVSALVTLLDKDHKTQLYRVFHAYREERGGTATRFSQATFKFSNFDSLMADLPKTAGSLTEGANAVSTTIAEDLQK